MSAPKKEIEVIRRLVIAAFEESYSSSYSGSNLDQLGVRVQSGVSSDGPTGNYDHEAEAMARKIKKLSRENQKYLSFFYNPNTTKHKPYAFVRVWMRAQAIFKGKNQETQRNSARMLQALLSCYRYRVLQSRDYPANPYKEFDGMTAAMWKRTYKNIWNQMDKIIREVDEVILNILN